MNSKKLLIKLIAFILYFAGNSFAFSLLNVIFPDLFVLGNVPLDPTSASVISGFVLALVVILVEPVFELLHIHVKHNITWALVYWFINTEAVWIMAHFASVTGIGIASFWVAVAVGAWVAAAQWGVWYLLQRIK